MRGNVQTGPSFHLTEKGGAERPLCRIRTGLNTESQFAERDHRREDGLLSRYRDNGVLIELAIG